MSDCQNDAKPARKGPPPPRAVETVHRTVGHWTPSTAASFAQDAADLAHRLDLMHRHYAARRAGAPRSQES